MKTTLQNYINSLDNRIEVLKTYKQEAIQREVYADVINYNAALTNLINTRDELKRLMK